MLINEGVYLRGLLQYSNKYWKIIISRRKKRMTKLQGNYYYFCPQLLLEFQLAEYALKKKCVLRL